MRKQLVAIALALLACQAAAQSFPSKPLRLIVPYPPGGTTDILARPVAKRLQDSLGQPVLIENKPGAGGNIGMDFVAKSTPDGHTLALSAISTLAIGASLYVKLPYDTLRDQAPVARLAAVPNVLVMHPSVPANSVRELIALAKSKPGELRFGSAGSGTTVHMAGELFRSMAGIDIQHVPYKGAEPIGDTPEEFASSLKAEVEKWAVVVKASGARVD